MKIKIPRIDLKEYNYDLPHERIAQHPVPVRDLSKLLVFNGKTISSDLFRNIRSHIPVGSLLVFNDTRVIRARLFFRKKSGALIEILCLEPLMPGEYEIALGSSGPVELKCMIGNLKKWKGGVIFSSFISGNKKYNLSADRICKEGDAWRVRFTWNKPDLSFSDLIELAGVLPLPPYMEREAVDEDLVRYQTVYSRVKGSVAAPTAGLHFTQDTLEKIRSAGIATTEITLHVGAGTFKPLKAQSVEEHEMHSEHFSVTFESVRLLKDFPGRIIPVGTTSVRTIESLYWLGALLLDNPLINRSEIHLGQWDAYRSETELSPGVAMQRILDYMERNKLKSLNASTGMMIVPGYRFRMIRGMVTNFHQPGSTLLLLVSAWTGNKWMEIYRYALENGFRFLSYGDSSILLKDINETGQNI